MLDIIPNHGNVDRQAGARPIPPPVPVTIATFPLSFNLVSLRARLRRLRRLAEDNLLSLSGNCRATDVGLALGIGAPWLADDSTITALIPHRQGLLPSVRVFIDHLAAELPKA